MKTYRTRIEIKFDDKIETVNYVCYINKTDKIALCFVGKSIRPSFYYRYSTVERLYEDVKNRLGNYDKIFQAKADRQAKMKELSKTFDIQNYLKVGDIIQNSWGYEQTNQEFYQVIKIKGTKQIVVREIAQEYNHKEGYSSMSAYTMPIKDQFLANAKEFVLKCRSTEDGKSFIIANPESYYYFHVWSGREQYVSWYA